MENLASHNTMSYLPVKQWYLKPLGFMSKCQSINIIDQFDLGVRYFDIRIRYDKNEVCEFAHGLTSYKKNVLRTLGLLNYFATQANCKVQVRLILETSKEDKRQEELFIEDCIKFKNSFSNLIFHCGRRKYDWKQLYDFGNPEPTLDQKISSMTWKIIDDWWPYLYARFMNKKNIKKGTEKDYLMLDYIHIQ